MTAILQTLETEIKTAMKAKDQARLETVRLIKTAVKNKEIEVGHALSETEFFAILKTLTKQRKEAIEQFKKGGRDDLAAKETSELEVISTFLPQQLSEEEVKTMIGQVIEKVGATSPKEMGAVMKELKEPTAGRFDGKALAGLVRAALQ